MNQPCLNQMHTWGAGIEGLGDPELAGRLCRTECDLFADCLTSFALANPSAFDIENIPSDMVIAGRYGPPLRRALLAVHEQQQPRRDAA